MRAHEPCVTKASMLASYMDFYHFNFICKVCKNSIYQSAIKLISCLLILWMASICLNKPFKIHELLLGFDNIAYFPNWIWNDEVRQANNLKSCRASGFSMWRCPENLMLLFVIWWRFSNME